MCKSTYHHCIQVKDIIRTLKSNNSDVNNRPVASEKLLFDVLQLLFQMPWYFENVNYSRLTKGKTVKLSTYVGVKRLLTAVMNCSEAELKNHFTSLQNNIKNYKSPY